MSPYSELLSLPLLTPSELNETQEALYTRLTRITEEGYGNCFTTKDNLGRFIGPFGIVMHQPKLGQAFYDIAAAIGSIPGLEAKAREVAILVVGAHYGAEYELYAHRALALRAGLAEADVDQLCRGIQPANLTADGVVAFQVADSMTTQAGPLRKEIWNRAEEAFGKDGSIALVHFVGFYAYTCMILNGFNARVPK